MRKCFFILLFMISLFSITSCVIGDPLPQSDGEYAERDDLTHQFLEAIYGGYLKIPQLSAKNDPGLDVCRVNQTAARRLFQKWTRDPESLDPIEAQKVNDILNLGKKYEIDADGMESILIVSSGTGCGYAFLAEILFDLYKNKPDTFEVQYGYPLYYEQDGKYVFNTETIFTDIFMRLNADIIPKIAEEENDYRILFAAVGVSFYGTDVLFEEMDRYIDAVIDDETEIVSLKRNVSPKAYKKYMIDNGYTYACIAVFDFILNPRGSNPHGQYIGKNAGHWMHVTDITGKGNFIVSSWGEEWELSKANPYVEDNKFFFFHTISDNDGGLIFVKVSDSAEGSKDLS